MRLKKPTPLRRVRLLISTREPAGIPSHWDVFDVLQSCRHFAESFGIPEKQARNLELNFFDTILYTIGDQCLLSTLRQRCETARNQTTIVLVGLQHRTPAARQLIDQLMNMGAIRWDGIDHEIPRVYEFRYQ